MAGFIRWKYINRHGPYAYVQASERREGEVESKHVAYLGRMGGNLVPGAEVRYGDEVMTVPPVPDEPGGAGPVVPNNRKSRAQQYVIKDESGVLVYVGHTGDLERRGAEHRRSGTLPPGGTMEAETGMLPRDAAERSETERVANHRRRRGRNPAGNDVTPRAPGTGRVQPANGS